MTFKVVPAAVKADVDVCNALEPPVKGCHAGVGIHLTIPSDFATRIAAGQDVPGCSYARLEADGSLFCGDSLQNKLNIPALILTLPPQQRADAAQLLVKVNAA